MIGDLYKKLRFCGFLIKQYRVIPSNELSFTVVYMDLNYYIVDLLYVALTMEAILRDDIHDGNIIYLYNTNIYIHERATSDVYQWKIRQDIGTFIKFSTIRFKRVKLHIFDGFDMRHQFTIPLNRTCVSSSYFMVHILADAVINEIFHISIKYKTSRIQNRHISITDTTVLRIRKLKALFQASHTFNCPRGLFPSMKLKSNSFGGISENRCAAGGFLLRIAITYNDMITEHGPYCHYSLAGLMNYMVFDKPSISNYYNQIIFYAITDHFNISLDLELSCSICEGIINPCSLNRNLNRKYISETYRGQFLTNVFLIVYVLEDRCFNIHLVSSRPRNCAIYIVSKVYFKYRSWSPSNRTDPACEDGGFRVIFDAVKGAPILNKWYATLSLQVIRKKCFNNHYTVNVEMKGTSRYICNHREPRFPIKIYTLCGSLYYQNTKETYHIYFYSMLANSLTSESLVNTYTHYRIYNNGICDGNFIEYFTRTIILHTQLHESTSIVYTPYSINFIIQSSHMALLTLHLEKESTCQYLIKYNNFQYLYSFFFFKDTYQVST